MNFEPLIPFIYSQRGQVNSTTLFPNEEVESFSLKFDFFREVKKIDESLRKESNWLNRSAQNRKWSICTEQLILSLIDPRSRCCNEVVWPKTMSNSCRIREYLNKMFKFSPKTKVFCGKKLKNSLFSLKLKPNQKKFFESCLKLVVLPILDPDPLKFSIQKDYQKVRELRFMYSILWMLYSFLVLPHHSSTELRTQSWSVQVGDMEVIWRLRIRVSFAATCFASRF